jgi:predicted Zn-dependent protease with MMP-like domain
MPWHNAGGLAAGHLAGQDRPAAPSAPLAGRPPRRLNTSRGPAVRDNGLVIDVAPEKFEEMVATALDSLPEDLGRLMRNVAVTVEDDPGPPGLLGLYQGIPLTSRGTNYAGALPDRITIYRLAICAICRTEEDVAVEVRRTVVHEVAHHFGIGDARLRELGW